MEETEEEQEAERRGGGASQSHDGLSERGLVVTSPSAAETRRSSDADS